MPRTWFDRWYRRTARPRVKPSAFRPRLGVLPLEDRTVPDATVTTGISHNLTLAELEKPSDPIYNWVEIRAIPASPAKLGLGDANNSVGVGYVFDSSNWGNLWFEADSGSHYTFDVRWQQYQNGTFTQQTFSATIDVTVEAAPDRIVVTTLADEADAGALAANPGGTGLSLREAVTLANADPGPSTITFDPGLTAGGEATVSLTQFDTGLDADEAGPSALRIRTPVTIQGPSGDNGISIDRPVDFDNPTYFRLFYVYGGAGTESSASLTMQNLTVSGGEADGGYGGGRRGGGGAGMGGAIYNRRGTVTLTGCFLTQNGAYGGSGSEETTSTTAAGGGGGMAADGATIAGGGPNGGQNSGTAAGGYGGGGGFRSTTGVGGAGGFGGGGGGASSGKGGTGGFGGGGGGSTSGTGGSSGFGGGTGRTAATYSAGGGAGMGGAIFNESGTLTLTNCTFTNNVTLGGGSYDYGGYGSGLGGAVFTRNGTVTLTFCTVAGNYADAGEAVYAVSDGSSGSGYTGGVAQVRLYNTILGVGNGVEYAAFAAGKTGGATAYDFYGYGNLIQAASGEVAETFNALTADPILEQASDNGGPTPTMPIGFGSPAFNHADSDAPNAPTADQRGRARAAFGKADIGAFEYDPSAITVSSAGDGDDGDYTPGNLTLREAVNLADVLDTDTLITFDEAVFAERQTIRLTARDGSGNPVGPLLVARLQGTTTIQGPAAGVVVSGDADDDGVGDQQILYVLAGSHAALSGVELTAGSAGFESGGAVYNQGTLTLTGATVSGSVAHSGGGIYSDTGSTLTLTDVTLTGNSASTGGGLALSDELNGCVATLTNVTVTRNLAYAFPFSGVGGGIFAGGATLTLTNTLVAGNGQADFAGSTPDDLFTDADTLSGSHNLIGVIKTAEGGVGLADGENGNRVGTGYFAGVGDLGDYGGPVRTVPLLPGSSALDAGTDTSAPTTDARGTARVGAADIGAFESRGFTVTATGGDNQTGGPGQTFATPLAVTVASDYGEPVSGGRVLFTGPASGPGIDAVAGVIDTDGGVSQTVTANDEGGGPYTVSAGGPGFSSPATFTLTNGTSAVVQAATGPEAGAYKAGTELSVALAYDQAVTVTGSPRIALTLTAGTGTTTVYATYASGSGSDKLVFTYTVLAGDNGHLTIGNSIDLNGGTLTNVGLASTTMFTAPDATGVVVDTAAPVVTAVARSSPATALTNATSVTWIVTFSEPVAGVDAVAFALTGAGASGATVSGVAPNGPLGGGGAIDSWAVTVSTGSDGTLGLGLTGTGTAVDVAGNALSTSLPGTGLQTFTVDKTKAAVTAAAVRFGPSGRYELTGAGRTTALPWQVTAVEVKFSEVVTATTATLTLAGLPAGVTVTGVTGGGTTTLRWTLSAALPVGSYSLGLMTTGANAVTDLAGNLGLGTAFSQTFSIGKQADVDGSGSVTSADLNAIRAKFTSTSVAYDPLYDLDGDGTVGNADYTLARGRVGT